MTEPRALAQIFEQAEASLTSRLHPDPYIRKSPRLLHMTSSKISLFLAAPTMPGGTKWYVLKPVFSYSSFVESSAITGNAIYPYV